MLSVGMLPLVWPRLFLGLGAQQPIFALKSTIEACLLSSLAIGSIKTPVAMGKPKPKRVVISRCNSSIVEL